MGKKRRSNSNESSVAINRKEEINQGRRERATCSLCLFARPSTNRADEMGVGEGGSGGSRRLFALPTVASNWESERNGGSGGRSGQQTGSRKERALQLKGGSGGGRSGLSLEDSGSSGEGLLVNWGKKNADSRTGEWEEGEVFVNR